jgi:predicted CXXCH cytochrome family protein
VITKGPGVHIIPSSLRLLALLALLGVSAPGLVAAADIATSSFGQIAIPSPDKPANADSCVEPVAVMRRDHMKFLLHQRDETVLDGERSKKYSLVGCIDCHNPSDANEEIVRYEDPQHFCAGCHNYASVKIDCFECHADRGLNSSQQSKLSPQADTEMLSMHTFRRKLEQTRGD